MSFKTAMGGNGNLRNCKSKHEQQKEFQMTIDFGLVVPPGPPKGDYPKWLVDVDASAQLLQDHFRSLWIYDHFFEGGDPIFEAWTILSFLAARFPNYEVGSLVLGQGYRNPALMALMAATLQTVSQGRFIMGIGAGWKEDEYLAYDYQFPRAGIRIEQLGDTLNIFKKLWTEAGQVSYEGKHYKVVDAWCEPKPDPMIPIMVGGGGKKTMRLAAQYADLWNWGMCDVDKYTEYVDILKQHCADLGRDIATLRLTWAGAMAIGQTEAEAQQYAEKSGVGGPFIGTSDHIAALMAEFIELGVDYFILNIAGLITEQLMPIIR
jgi:alkanesulfonate monooxygenase SsuD/methylene tetrahydromethanopterin reductase-like flavin-dependent oxidoreductase (luciferase family)